MASILGQVAFENSSAYVSAKHGVVGLTKNAAVEYAKQGLRVNSVGPAFNRTPLIAALEENTQVRDQLVSCTPSDAWANRRKWLRSDKAPFVTGTYYEIDGGYLAR
jgi:NAD(P)-dependent dehydrogenase (short-subunit alcohol dehydrogenase family)